MAYTSKKPQGVQNAPAGDQGPWGKRTGGAAPQSNNGAGEHSDSDRFNHSHDKDRFGGGMPPRQEDELSEALGKLYDGLRRRFDKGGGSSGGISMRQFGWVFLILFAVWLASGLYRVNPGEQGVVLRFGEWTNQGALSQEGLHWHLPWPIESSITPQVEEVRQIDIGFRGSADSDIIEESQMLTGDQNIIDVDFTVQWRIRNAGKYLFNIRDPDSTIKIAAESAMREIIGRTEIQRALTEGRAEIALKARETLQAILDEYDSGILVSQVTLQGAQPPEPVIDAFEEVQRARQDLERLGNQADAYSNKVIPEARGEAQRIRQEAAGYRAKVIAEAEGESLRFLQVYSAYSENPEVTARRLYLETMEQVLADSNKVILRGDGEGGVLPVLPLPQQRVLGGGITDPGFGGAASGVLGNGVNDAVNGGTER